VCAANYRLGFDTAVDHRADDWSSGHEPGGLRTNRDGRIRRKEPDRHSRPAADISASL
jgi:hypothetical protein